jgi:uncharacterized protein
VTTTELPISVDYKTLASFCRARNIRKLSVFGSVLRDDFTPASDVDVLIEFLPGKTPGLAFFGYAEQLGALIGHKVDLNTEAFLNKHFRNDILQEAITLYEQA